MAVDAARNVVQRIAHHQAGHAARHFHHLDGAANFGARIVDGLSVFGGQRRRQLILVLFEQHLVAIQRLHPFHHRHVAPLQISGVRGLDRAIHVVSGGVGNLRDFRARCGVGHGHELPVAGALPLAVDVEGHSFDGRLACDHCILSTSVLLRSARPRWNNSRYRLFGSRTMQNFDVPFITGSPFFEITVTPAAFSALTVAVDIAHAHLQNRGTGILNRACAAACGRCL